MVAMVAMMVVGSLLVAPTAAQAAGAATCAGSAAPATQVGCPAGLKGMAAVTKTVIVTKGDWRTLETFVNASGVGVFNRPAGARIKIHYGVGFLGFDRQKQTLDGVNDKQLTVGKTTSIIGGRMQIKVDEDTAVTYTIFLPGP
jgi:hypothetical protein